MVRQCSLKFGERESLRKLDCDQDELRLFVSSCANSVTSFYVDTLQRHYRDARPMPGIIAW